MFTTCPNCALNLAVTAADLRVGQGFVRCGRCVSVFNALISLADEAEVGPELARVEDTASATQSRPIPEELKSAAAPPAPGEGAQITEESRNLSTGSFETIVLEGDAILQTEEFVDEAEVDEQLKALAKQLGDPPPGTPTDTPIEAQAAVPRPAPAAPLPPALREPPPPAYDPPHEAASSAESEAESEPGLDALLAPKSVRRPPSPWLLGAIGLAVLLAGQAAHHWRYGLARHLPFVGSLYAALGAPLTPQWQLGAYDVRQLGAAADPADAHRIEVRASVHNAAERAQPAPVLRVVLQDRFGNEVARHDSAPADYLRGNALAMLAADQRVDASFWVDDPEQKAVGFEIDACLREPGGTLRCAGDVRTAAR